MSPWNRRTTQDVPPVAALGVSMEIHLEKLRVALHHMHHDVKKKRKTKKKTATTTKLNQERLDEDIRQS